MKEYQKICDIPQWHHSYVSHFASFSIIMLKMTHFYVVFSSVSIERGLGQFWYFVSIYKPIMNTESMKVFILAKTLL